IAETETYQSSRNTSHKECIQAFERSITDLRTQSASRDFRRQLLLRIYNLQEFIKQKKLKISPLQYNLAKTEINLDADDIETVAPHAQAKLALWQHEDAIKIAQDSLTICQEYRNSFNKERIETKRRELDTLSTPEVLTRLNE